MIAWGWEHCFIYIRYIKCAVEVLRNTKSYSGIRVHLGCVATVIIMDCTSGHLSLLELDSESGEDTAPQHNSSIHLIHRDAP